MPQSKAIQRLEEKMSDIEPGTLRYETLEASKRFKTSWIELGRMLWTVSKEKKFREWGYLSFEAYCLKEVGVKAATAKKLLHSYYFLEKEEPTVLKRLTEDSPVTVPNIEAVNLLRLLKRRQEDLPKEGYNRVRSYVLEKGRDVPEVRQEVRSLLEAAEPDSSEEARATRRQTVIHRMIGTLKGLSQEMAVGKIVTGKLLDEIAVLVKKLEEAL